MPHTTHALPPSSSEIDDGPGTEPGGRGTPSVSITASPSSIEAGYSSRLSFNSAYVTRCVIDNGIGAVAVNRSDSRIVSPTQTTTYTISCDAANQVLVDQVTISVVPAPTPLTAYCEAGPNTAQIQETVQWSVTHSTGSGSGLAWQEGRTFTTKVCSGGSNYTNLNDSCPENISNGMTCSPEGERCKVSSGCNGQVYTDPEGNPNAHTQYGGVTPYTCVASGSDTASYSYAWTGTDSLSGTTQTVSKAYTTVGQKTGRATVTRNTGGSASATCTANISPKTPTATLTANPSSIVSGSSSTLSWGSTNAGECSLNESIGSVATSGTRSVSPGSTTTYTLMCAAPGTGSAGTWQYYDSDISDYSCPVTDPNKAYSSVQNCPANPQGKACTSGSGMTLCKKNTVNACNIYTDLYQCQSSPSSPSQAATATATVTVTAGCTGPSCLPNGEILSCSASPTTITAGGSTTWTASPADTSNFRWTPSETSTPINGGQTLSRTYSSAGTYAMSVSNRGATASCSNNVTVTALACGASTPTITASPTRVQAGGTSTLTVSASGVDTTCVVSGPGVSRTISGASCTVPTTTITTGAITSLSTFTISCDSGESSAKTIVNVVPKIQEF